MVAEYVTVEQTETLMSELADAAPRGSFLYEAVSYAVPDQSFHFAERRQLALGR